MVLIGCNNSSTTSTSRSGNGLTFNASVESSSGSQINMIYSDTLVAGEPQTFFFQLRPQGAAPGATTGTVHWGDFSDSRIRDDHNIPVVKTWTESGSYDISVQIDGERKVAIMRGLSVTPTATSSAITTAPAAPMIVFKGATGRFVGHVCNPPEGTPVAATNRVRLELPSPWADATNSLVSAVTSSGCPSVVIAAAAPFSPGTANSDHPTTRGCTAGSVFTFELGSADTDGAFCRWPVQ